MSQNRPDNDNTTTGGAGGGTTGAGGTSSGAGGTSSGATGDPSQWGARTAGGAGGAGTGAATGLAGDAGTSTGLSTTPGGGEGGGIADTARQYGQKAAEYGQQAKEFLGERFSGVGDRIQDLRNKDYGQMAEEAKDYARQNPGQALLVAAAAGFVLGLLLRGGRR